MSRNRIIEDVLDQAQREELDRDKLVQSFSSLAEHFQKRTQEIDVRDAVCRAIINGILPKLVFLEPKDQEGLVTQCQLILSHGDPEKIFHDLCVSLKRVNGARPVNARFLLWFVTGNVERLVRVLGRLESQETVSFLIHMPSLLSNAFSTDNSSDFTFQEMDYFIDLSKAICKVSTTSNQHSSTFISSLVQRMVTLGKAETLVSTCFAFERGQYLESVLKRAPHASIEVIVRAALENDIRSSDHQQERVLTETLRSVILANATAQEACTGKIPFSRIPLKRQKASLHRLVDAVAEKGNETVWKRALVTAANVWNSVEFTYGAEVVLQQQVTRLVLYYLRSSIRKKMHVITETQGILLLFTPGIQLRLSENDPRIRRHGMVVGEAASIAEQASEKLSFPRDGIKEEISSNALLEGKRKRDEDSDSDFSAIAHDEDSVEIAEPEDNLVSRSNATAGDEVLEMIPLASSKPSVPSRTQEDRRTKWSRRASDDSWQFEDDWESVDSWEGEDSATDVQFALIQLDSSPGNGTVSRAPVSVNRLLSAVINANKSPGGGLAVDATTLVTTLDQIAALPQSGLVYGETLRRAAVELCLEVCRVDIERYPDAENESLATSRRKALEQMIRVDFEGCGLALIDKIICGPSSDVFSRIEALSALTRAVRAKGVPVTSENQPVSSYFGDRFAKGKDARIVGQPPLISVSKIEKKSLSSSHAVGVAEMVRVFHHLAQRMCEGGGAEFLHVESRDSQLWGHAIVALSSMASSIGTSRDAMELRTTVIEISMRRVLKLEPDAIVRRAIVLAVITVLRSMELAEVSSFLVNGIAPGEYEFSSRNSSAELAGECFEFLTRSAEFDADLGVRRFAKQALAIWARRVEQLT